MWTYEQATGRLYSDNGTLVGTGYSGAGEFKNRPDAQSLRDEGPIPCGRYTIGHPYDSMDHGPYVLPLMPHIGNQMFGRSNFLMHGDSIPNPGKASKGCVVMARAIRELVGEDEDNVLIVVSGLVETDASIHTAT
jgi:Protein of unknown function (DUF2778)